MRRLVGPGAVLPPLLSTLLLASLPAACSPRAEEPLHSPRSSSRGEALSAPVLPEASAAEPEAAVAGGPSLRDEMLAAHNRWRGRYGVPALVWSEELAAHAAEWAQELASGGFELRHRPDNPYGENLFAIQGRRASASEVVEAWGSEERLYHPERNDWWPRAAHFSQLIWESSRRLGCAVARSGLTEHWVCNYDPPGNLRGQRPYGSGAAGRR